MEVHIVVKGDTLWKIARQYGISFEELKRVNAHLANPEYIVPGMKIFIPAHSKGGKGGKKETDKGKAPVHHKVPVKEEPHKKPIPLPPTAPQMEKPAPVPIPLPTPAPPQMPMPQPMPMPPQAQHFPVHQVVQPFYGVPCGWMPIYDADCHPFMHGSHMPAAPSTRPMENHLPPMSMESMESPIVPGQGPSMMPPFNPMPNGWQMIESTAIQELESSMDGTPCPPETGYIPQAVSPMGQGGWSPLQPCPPPIHNGCGCGCHGGHQPMIAPVQWYCHPCHPHLMQPTPYQMPNQGYGAY